MSYRVSLNPLRRRLGRLEICDTSGKILDRNEEQHHVLHEGEQLADRERTRLQIEPPRASSRTSMPTIVAGHGGCKAFRTDQSHRARLDLELLEIALSCTSVLVVRTPAMDSPNVAVICELIRIIRELNSNLLK